MLGVSAVNVGAGFVVNETEYDETVVCFVVAESVTITFACFEAVDVVIYTNVLEFCGPLTCVTAPVTVFDTMKL